MMCNACGFYCCAWDGFDKCGCDHCPEPACHDHTCWACGEEEYDCTCGDDDDYGPHDDECISDDLTPAFTPRDGAAPNKAAPKNT